MCSPYPWKPGSSTTSGELIYDANDDLVGTIAYGDDRRRIIACLNACQHLTTEAIEQSGTLVPCTVDDTQIGATQ